MLPSDYVAAVGRRRAAVVVTALLGAALGCLAGVLASPVFASTTTVHVAVAEIADATDAAYAARIADDLLPSLASVAQGGSERIEVSVAPSASLVSITASAPDAATARDLAESAAARLRGHVADTYTGADGPVLDLQVVVPAGTPTGPENRGPAATALLGLGAGGAAAVLWIGLSELVRPRIGPRTPEDVPVVAALPARGPADGPAAPARRAAVERLTWLVAENRTGPSTTAVVGGDAASRAVLAAELTDAARGRDRPLRFRALPLDDLAEGSGAVDGVLVLADARRTALASLRALIARVTATGVPLHGVVLDDGRRRAGTALSRFTAGPGQERAGRPGASAERAVTRATAVAALAAVGLAQPLPMGASSGLVAVVALLPVWGGVLRTSPALRWLLALAGAGLVSGALLARAAAADHAFAPHQAAETGFLVLTAVGTVGLVMWSREHLGWPVVGTALGSGLLVQGILDVPGSANAWKFQLVVPVSLIVLSLLAARRGPVPSLVALGALGGVSILDDARSAFGFCVLAAVVVLWQARPDSGRPGSRWTGVVVLAAVGAVAYALLTELLLSGALGARLQARTATQIDQSGSLLLGGRPEWSATWALMREHPLGFGLGTVPSPDDVRVAAEGMAVANIPTAEGYLQNYMLAGRFELHSVAADLWSNLGPAGLLLAVVMAVLLTAGLADLVHRRQAPAVICFLVPTALWFLAFGPLPANLGHVAIALGAVLAARAALPAAEAGADRPLERPGVQETVASGR